MLMGLILRLGKFVVHKACQFGLLLCVCGSQLHQNPKKRFIGIFFVYMCTQLNLKPISKICSSKNFHLDFLRVYGYSFGTKTYFHDL